LLAGALLASAGCAAGSAANNHCPSETWTGKCNLRDVQKVEERELPMAYVVYEAIYTPEANPDYPQFTPAEARVRMGTPAAHEFALVDHLKAQPVVTCHAKTAAVSCLPEALTADVKPFVADAEPTTPAAATGIVGCAAIDAASEQDRLARTRAEGSPISEHFTFGEGSAVLAPEADDSARVVAKRMADDPNLECLGVVGQTTAGEPISLAEARARAVKQLLISLGVDARRLQTIAANASVAAGSKTRPAVDPESRRVSLRIMLQTSAKPAP